MADFGYDISDYNKVDDIFGTMDDFISLQKKLKSMGNEKYIRLLMIMYSVKFILTNKSKQKFVN